jgi:hypothetical protein
LPPCISLPPSLRPLARTGCCILISTTPHSGGAASWPRRIGGGASLELLLSARPFLSAKKAPPKRGQVYGLSACGGGSLGLPQRDNAAIRATGAGSLAANTRCQSVAAEQQKARYSCAVLLTQTDRAADHCNGRVGSRESPASLGERGFQGHASRGRIPVFRSRAIREPGFGSAWPERKAPPKRGKDSSWKENQDEATATSTKIAAVLRLEGFGCRDPLAWSKETSRPTKPLRSPHQCVLLPARLTDSPNTPNSTESSPSPA